MADHLGATSAIESTTQTAPTAKAPMDEPRPGILRRPTVQFENANGPALLPTDASSQENPEASIPLIKVRTGTVETNVSKASSKLDPRWRKQTILSFGKS